MLNLEFAHGQSGSQPTVENLPKGCHQSAEFSVGFLGHRMRAEIAVISAICDCDAHRGPQKSRDFRDKTKQCCIVI